MADYSILNTQLPAQAGNAFFGSFGAAQQQQRQNQLAKLQYQHAIQQQQDDESNRQGLKEYFQSGMTPESIQKIGQTSPQTALKLQELDRKQQVDNLAIREKLGALDEQKRKAVQNQTEQLAKLALYGDTPEKWQSALSTLAVNGQAPQIPFEARGAIINQAKTIAQLIEETKPLSGVGKIEADMASGRVSDKMGNLALKKETYIRPVDTVVVNQSDPDYNRQLDYWASVIQKGGSMPAGLARGKSGSEFVREVAKRAALGQTPPEDLMANQAEFMGSKAGQRTLGTRMANIQMAATEAAKMMPIALSASNNVDRTQYPTLNHVLLAVEKGTGDENVTRLGVATNSLINAYARAISPSGVPTVHDKEHAREILANAFTKGQYAAALGVMQQEIDAALASPKQVKSEMRTMMTGKSLPTQTGGFKYLGKE